MVALQGRRILIVGRDYFFYTRTIVEELKQAHGAEVTYIPIVAETFVYSALKRIPGAARHWLARYHRAQIAALAGQSFDAVLFIQVHQLEPELVALYKESFSAARFILYYWDSLVTHDYRPYLKYFDEAWTFDPDDAQKEPAIKLLPLFFCERFKSLRQQTSPVHDLVFVGTAMSARRYDDIVQFRRWASLNQVRFFDYLYVSPLFYLRSLVRGRRLRGVHFRPISAQRLIDIYTGARAILDLPDNIQSGFTMRTFESLGAQRKLVTTQQRIASADFFDATSVFVLGLHGEFPSAAFFRASFLPNHHIEGHSLRAWLLQLFGSILITHAQEFDKVDH